MLIKKKSLIVALASSFIIALVLVLTLAGYLIYIELKGKEFDNSYRDLLQKANAKVYAKHIEISGLDSRIEDVGALKGKLIVEGVLKNKGSKSIRDLLIKARFLDRDGAVIYEVAFHPQEPSLGSSALPYISIPYLSTQNKIDLRPGESLPFKRILTNYPDEIMMAMRKETGVAAKRSSMWPGRLVFEVLSVEF